MCLLVDIWPIMANIILASTIYTLQVTSLTSLESHLQFKLGGGCAGSGLRSQVRSVGLNGVVRVDCLIAYVRYLQLIATFPILFTNCIAAAGKQEDESANKLHVKLVTKKFAVVYYHCSRQC